MNNKNGNDLVSPAYFNRVTFGVRKIYPKEQLAIVIVCKQTSDVVYFLQAFCHDFDCPYFMMIALVLLNLSITGILYSL